jgi:glycosyltransferase involved in cell wall biosynthesis
MTNREFVEAIYKNVLGKNGDEEGIKFWTNYLDTNSRSDMVSDFVELSLTLKLTKENFPNLSDEELAKVYNRATCFVYPSYYEGFGLPPLEAMACGTPVITSKLSSIPEVCSDSAIYCDAHDIDDIKEKIEMLLKDETLQKELIEKGIKRASLFTWKRSADMHKELFLKVLEG